MEKRGYIDPDWTPPAESVSEQAPLAPPLQEKADKEAAELADKLNDLDEHLSRRLSDAVRSGC